MNLLVSEIAKITDGKLIGQGDFQISQLLIDSRSYSLQGKTVFFALRGPHHNGHHYITQLIARGVNCFVLNETPENSGEFSNTSFILVKDSLLALQKLAAYCRKQYLSTLIGITGSNGKTIIKEWIAQILSGKKNVIRSPKSYNSQVGVPLSLWLLEESFEYAIIEAGISKPGEMEKLEQMIRPDIGIISNIGTAHQQNFSDINEKLREKLKLFKDSSVILYCKDHELVHKTIQETFSASGKQLISWSGKQAADLEIHSITTGESFTSFIVKSGEIEQLIEIPFTDKASVENAIHVCLLLVVLGFKLAEITPGMRELQQVAMRLELKKGIRNCTLINDSYNSDLASLDIALDFMEQQKQQENKTLILSDIYQSGLSDEKLYSRVSEMLISRGITRFIGIGSSIYENADKFQGNKQFFRSSEEFLNHFSRNQFQNELILLKGARDFEFEKISQQLEYQVHETVLEINLNAITHNLNYYRNKIGKKTKLMAIVKAFSYGSSSYEIANLLQYQGVNYLAVAIADEGILLREKGISLPVMVMSPDPNSFHVLTTYSLEPEVYSFRILYQFIDHLKSSGIQNYPIHIKVDTGMHRLGFSPDDLPDLLEFLKIHREVKINSVFSHLAASDKPQHDKFTLKQIKLFKKVQTMFDEVPGHEDILYHILNSAGIERFPEAHFDMVRLGIGLHGIGTTENNHLEVVSTFTSTITQIKKVAAGESVGYNRKGSATGERIIAIVPVGYADGIDRKLGNGNGSFYIKGKRVAIAGEVCMDMCMLDVTGLNIREGDKVEIFGKNILVTELAEKLDTISYEILASISQRVKRIYIQE